MRTRARLHHLQRETSRRFHGWMVQITRRNRLVCREYFSDRKYGGAQGALAAAKAYRDRKLRELPPAVLVKIQNTRSRTRVMGVHRIQRLGKHGVVFLYYVASWVWPPRTRYQVRRTFSVLKYGAREARRLAVEARREAVARTVAWERARLLAALSREKRERGL